MRTVVAGAVILVSILILELARWDVEISHFKVGQTPVTEYVTHGAADGPTVIMTHGFAGSQQMMQGYALPLARAGYRVYVFEFLGHGRHSQPMSGDVTVIDGTTQLLVQQAGSVINAISEGTPVALVGHSMSTDILVRTAINQTDIGPMVLISAYSQAITASKPENLLLVSGAWEARLRAFAQEAVMMVNPSVSEGETAVSEGVRRLAVAAPFSEHVSVLHSRFARAQTLAWLDKAYVRRSDVTILPTGWAILGALIGLVFLFAPIAERLPERSVQPLSLAPVRFATLLVVPAIVAPLIAVPLNPEALPVLVADYLGLHLLIYGVLQLALLRFWGIPSDRISWLACAALLAWCAVFGLLLDRYAANFWPTFDRLWIIGVMLIGTVPFLLADTLLTKDATFTRRIMARVALLLSLGLAVALDFDELFFLVLIAPVLVLFFLVFGSLERAVARRSGSLSSGLALGLMLAWALGVSFPLFQS